jgi:hypothetical protein
VIEIRDLPDGVDVSTEDEEGDDGSVSVFASVIANGRNRTASIHLNRDEVSDDDLAEALVKAVQAAAQLHSSGAWMALQRRLS